MSRARLIALAALGAAALAATGVAAAGHRTQTTQQAAATFDAGSVSHEKTTTCVADDGTYENTTATYTGTAGSSDARLSGSLQIRAHSVLNSSTGLGWMEGSFRVRGNDAGTHGTFHAAIAGGNAVGAIAGTVNRPAGKLVASLAAGFTPSGGFANGTLGAGGSPSGAGTIFSRGSCTRAKNQVFTAVSRLTLTPRAAVPPENDLKAAASGSVTLDVTRGSNGEITAAKAVFYVNYRFQGQVTIDGPRALPGRTRDERAESARLRGRLVHRHRRPRKHHADRVDLHLPRPGAAREPAQATTSSSTPPPAACVTSSPASGADSSRPPRRTGVAIRQRPSAGSHQRHPRSRTPRRRR